MAQLKIADAEASVRLATPGDAIPAITLFTSLRDIVLARSFPHFGSRCFRHLRVVLHPAFVLFLGVLLDVLLGQLLERAPASRSPSLGLRIDVSGDGDQDLGRQPARLLQVDGADIADRVPARPAAERIDDLPDLAGRVDGEREPRPCVSHTRLRLSEETLSTNWLVSLRLFGSGREVRRRAVAPSRANSWLMKWPENQ